MKKLITRFNKRFYACYLRKPTNTEIEAFKIGVQITTHVLHEGLHDAINKIDKNLIKR